MATYSTTADVERRMGADVLAAVTRSTPYDADEVEGARQAAYGLINGYIGVRYAVPVDVAAHADLASLLRGFELDLVEWSLWGNVRSDMPERTQKKRDAAIEFLKGVAAGTIALPSVGELAPTSQVDNQAQVVGPERIMSRENLQGMI